MPITVPSTTTVTTHGLVISVGAGNIIGAISQWGPQQSRTVTPVFEFGAITPGGGTNESPSDSGEPYELVPGNISGTSISIQRYDIYTNRFESAFGTQNLIMLTRQTNNMRFVELWQGPDQAIRYQNVYYGAYFTQIGRSLSATGDRITNVNGSAMYSRRREA